LFDLILLCREIIGKDATTTWYNEIKFFDFNHGEFTQKTGHLTQLLWKDSKKLGVGIAYTSDRHKVYIVAQYTPPGNYAGQFRKNVSPAKC
jgi:hypothetical protein